MTEASAGWIKAAEMVGLSDEAEVIEALGELARTWSEMAAELSDFSSVLSLLRAIADGTANENVEKAFAKAGANSAFATLTDASAKLNALLNGMPEPLLKLLEPIGTFDEQATGKADRGIVRWPIVDKHAGGLGEAKSDAAYTLELDASSALTMEAGDTWPFSDPVPGPLLRLHAQGALKPKGSASLPFNAVEVGASAEGSATCALDYYFAVADPARIYAIAVGERLNQLADPFDFDELWDAFAKTDLSGLHYEFDGSAKVAVSVAFADATALGAGVAADFGAKVSVDFTLSGKYFLTFRVGPRSANGEPQIIAALSRERSSGSSLATKLGVTVDLASLAAKVHAVLQNALDRSNDIVQEITPFLSPGTWLQKHASDLISAEAKSLINDDELRSALERDLKGIIGIDTPDTPVLVEWLSEQLEEALNSAHGWADEKAEAAEAIIGNLGRSLPAFAQSTIRAKLGGTATKLVKEVREKIEERVNELFDKNAEALGHWLQSVGATSTATVSSLDQALAGVRKVVERYQTLFEKIVQETANAARMKVAAAVQIEESMLNSATLELEGTFLARSDAARSVFRAITRGDLTRMLGVIKSDGGSSSDFALNPSRTSLKRYAERKEGVGFELVLFGFGVSGNDLLKGTADVLVDGSGNVQVDAKAELDRRFKGLDADREIRLITAYSLVLARETETAAASLDRALGLAVTLSHADQGLKRHEVERFVGSLFSAGLLPSLDPQLASRTITRWIGSPGSNGRIAGALMLKLALDRRSLSKLLGLGSGGSTPSLPDERRRVIVMTAFEVLQDSKAVDRHAVDATLSFLLERAFRGKSREDVVLDRQTAQRVLERDATSGRGFRKVSENDQPFVEAIDLSFGLLEMIETLRRIYFSSPEVSPDHNPLTWTAQDYRNAEFAAARAVRGWLQLNNVLFWSDSKVHPRVIALIETLLRLTDQSPAEALSLTMTRNDEAAVPETVVLASGAPR